METPKVIFEWILFVVFVFLWMDLREAIRTRNFKDFGLIHIKLFRDILIDKDGREKLNKKREKALIRKGLIKDPPKKDRDQSDKDKLWPGPTIRREKLNKKREEILIRKGLIKDPTKEDRDQSEYKN